MKQWLYIFTAVILSGCATGTTSKSDLEVPKNWVELNLSNFRVMAPPQWGIQNPGGTSEAYAGGIGDSTLSLSYTYSTTGVANHLLSPEKQYIENFEWWDGEGSFPFSGTTKKMHLPTPNQKKRYPKADYIADLRNGNRVVAISIELPPEIRTHNFKIDSNDKYVFKTIWPKVTGKGMTGVYIHDRHSNFNFQMNARNLSSKDQEAALLLFKTIQFKQDQ